MPLAIQIGIGAAALGLIVLVASLIAEKIGKREAAALGADTVVNLRFTTSQVMAGAAELLAYGTAVRIK